MEGIVKKYVFDEKTFAIGAPVFIKRNGKSFYGLVGSNNGLNLRIHFLKNENTPFFSKEFDVTYIDITEVLKGMVYIEPLADQKKQPLKSGL